MGLGGPFGGFINDRCAAAQNRILSLTNCNAAASAGDGRSSRSCPSLPSRSHSRRGTCTTQRPCVTLLFLSRLGGCAKLVSAGEGCQRQGDSEENRLRWQFFIIWCRPSPRLVTPVRQLTLVVFRFCRSLYSLLRATAMNCRSVERDHPAEKDADVCHLPSGPRRSSAYRSSRPPSSPSRSSWWRSSMRASRSCRRRSCR